MPRVFANYVNARLSIWAGCRIFNPRQPSINKVSEVSHPWRCAPPWRPPPVLTERTGRTGRTSPSGRTGRTYPSGIASPDEPEGLCIAASGGDAQSSFAIVAFHRVFKQLVVRNFCIVNQVGFFGNTHLASSSNRNPHRKRSTYELYLPERSGLHPSGTTV